jgi:hypothetical protein
MLITSNNELLPNLELQSIIVGQNRQAQKSLVSSLNDISNLYLEVELSIIPKLTELDQIITDEEYYKYLLINVEIPEISVFERRSIDLNNTDNVDVINKKIKFNTIPRLDSFSLKISQKFDFDKLVNDNPVLAKNRALLQLLKDTYGTELNIQLPVLNDKKIVKLSKSSVTKDNSVTLVGELSQIIDNRIIDGLNFDSVEFNDLSTQLSSDLNVFLNNFYQSHNNENLNTFIVIDYAKFIRNTNFFKFSLVQEFDLIIKIENNEKLIDLVNVTNQDNTFTFTSMNNVSSVHNRNNNRMIFSFKESITDQPTRFTNNYKITLTSKDVSFTNFYNRVTNTGTFIDLRNSYNQIKNLIYVSAKATDSKSTTYFLNPKTQRFTSSFVRFYNQKESFYNSQPQYKIDVNVKNFLFKLLNDVYNKFNVNQLTTEQIDLVSSMLDLRNSTYDLWQRVFITFDSFFNNLESYLYSKITTPSTTIVREFKNIKIVKHDSYYSLTNNQTFENYANYAVEQVNNLFVSSGSYGIINCFTTNTNTYLITNNNEIKFDSEIYNSVNTYVNNLSSIRDSNFIQSNLFGATNLEKYGVSIDLLERTKEKATKIIQQSVGTITNKVPVVSNSLLKTKQLNNLNDNFKKIIINKNELNLSILKGINKETLINTDVFPSIAFSRFNLLNNSWQIIENVDTLQNNDLVKFEIDQVPDIFIGNKIKIEQIGLVNNYFIVTGVTR